MPVWNGTKKLLRAWAAIGNASAKVFSPLWKGLWWDAVFLLFSMKLIHRVVKGKWKLLDKYMYSLLSLQRASKHNKWAKPLDFFTHLSTLWIDRTGISAWNHILKLFLQKHVMEIQGVGSLATQPSVSWSLTPGCAPIQAMYFQPCQSYRCAWNRTPPRVVQEELKNWPCAVKRNKCTQAYKALAQMVQLRRAATLQHSVWSASTPYVSRHLKWAGSWPDILCVCVSLAHTTEIRLKSSLLGLLDPKG